MNRRTLNVVLLSAALAGTMVSCQKDEIVLSHETDSEVERISSLDISQKSLAYEVVTITYWRNGMRYKKGFSSYEDYQAYILSLIRQTQKGYTITIEGRTNSNYIPSETDRLEFQSKDATDVAVWAEEMGSKGYNVTCSFDFERGIYIGTATLGETGTTTTAISTERDSDSM